LCNILFIASLAADKHEKLNEKQGIEKSEDIAAIAQTIEQTTKEILELEETIANLKQKRNELIGPLEDLQDDVADMQALIKVLISLMKLFLTIFCRQKRVIWIERRDILKK